MKNFISYLKKSFGEFTTASKELIFNKNAVFTAAFSLICGVIIHLFYLSNYIVNHDSMLSIFSNSDWLIIQGKWFVTPLTSLEGNLNLNFLGALIGIVAVALSAAVITSVFNVKSKLYCALIGACLVAFPSVASINLYNSLDYFGIAFFLAVLSAYYLTKYGAFNTVLGMLLLTLSLGAYQAYLGAALGILVLFCAVRFLSDEKCLEVIKSGISYVVKAVCSIGIYYVTLKILLRRYNVQLSEYKGISNMTDNLAPKVLIKSTIKAYTDVKDYLFKGVLNLFNLRFSVLTIILAVLMLCAVVVLIMAVKKRPKALNLLFAGALIILILPIAVNIIGILAANTTFYYISVFPFVILFIAPIVLLSSAQNVSCQEKYTAEKGKKLLSLLCAFVKTATAVVLTAICFLWTIQCNVSYHKLMLANKSFDSKLTTLSSKIEAVDNYNTEMQVAFVGNAPFDFLESKGALKEFDNIYNTTSMGLWESKGILYNSEQVKAYLKNILSIEYSYADTATVLESHKSTIEKMPAYPNAGSIKVIDNIIIVKLSNDL